MTVPPCNEIWIQFYDLVMELQQKLAFGILQYQLSFLDHLALYRSQRVADTDCLELLGVGKAPLSEYASISKDIINGSVQKSVYLVTVRGNWSRVLAVNLTGIWYSL